MGIMVYSLFTMSNAGFMPSIISCGSEVLSLPRRARELYACLGNDGLYVR